MEELRKKAFDKESEKTKDDFFMTSAKIVVDNTGNKTEDKKENNINENDNSILGKNDDKKLETKDIEIMDLKSENAKKEEKVEENKEEEKEDKK